MADRNGAAAFESVYELSRLLNTGLDRETLVILLKLIEQGVHPEALAAVVRDLRKEAAAARQETNTENSAPPAIEYGSRQFQPPQQEPMKKRRSEYP